MSTESAKKGRPTRRALLGTAAIGAAAVVADVVGASSAQASDGDPVVGGTTNEFTSDTEIRNTNTDGGAKGVSIEVNSVQGTALVAKNLDPGGNAVVGIGGVHGYGASVGVSGYSVEKFGAGVAGQHGDGGVGVRGNSSGVGGTGVSGFSGWTDGVGVEAIGSDDGIALKVRGPVEFSRSGKVTVPAGSDNVIVPVSGTVHANLAFANVQKHAVGWAIESVVVTKDQIRIWLTAPAPVGGLPVAWFVLN
ncbi:MAG: hypothetical protein ABI586_10165 [Candidatus Nanopelagicales bacterium]